MTIHPDMRIFQPPGPVGAAFLKDVTSVVRALLGPVGGGKSSCCVFDIVKNASEMPICKDGTIKFKLAVIGQTYGQLERNLFPTWKRWLPADDGPDGNWTVQDFKGGGGRYASHKIEWDVVRWVGPRLKRVTVYFEAIFAAIGDQSVEDFMRGFEPTAFWLYEVDLLPRAVLDQAIFRLGRCPSVADMPPETPLRGFPGYTLGNLPPGVEYEKLPPDVLYRSFVICDLNAPDVDSWFYELFEENLPSGFRLYKQPSGLSKLAENLKNLPPGYYQRQVTVFSNRKGGKNLIKRMVHAQYAPSMDGEPVYEEYSDELHLAREPIKAIKGIPITIGLDAGMQRPAAAILQQKSNGQWILLGECVPGRGGARKFCDALKREIAELSELAGVDRLEIGSMYSDPAGFSGSDQESGELAWAERVMLEMGLPVLPTETNEIDPRLEAVRDELTYMIDGDTPALLISPRCKTIRKGFASHYRYHKERVGNSERTSDKPEKNDYSHPHDALQYALLGKKGRYGVVGQKRGKRDPAAEARERALAEQSAAGEKKGVVRDGGMKW